MNVRIGEETFNSVFDPIVLVLDQGVKDLFANQMDKDNLMYAFCKHHGDSVLKVKIGDKIYNSLDTPILLVLNSDEKKLLQDMGEQNTFCSFNEKCDTNEILKFMKDIE